MSSFYTTEELNKIGFKAVGVNVLISRKASLYGISRISIGNDVRIDDFCVISAGKSGIEIGNHVHIAIFASLQGEGKITLHDFVGISSRSSIYSSNDDYSGTALTGPTIPTAFTNVKHADVTFHKHVVVGSSCIILPGVTMHTGAAVGALSLVSRDCEEFYIYKGNPAVKLKSRSRNLLSLEQEFANSLKQ